VSRRSHPVERGNFQIDAEGALNHLDRCRKASLKMRHKELSDVAACCEGVPIACATGKKLLPNLGRMVSYGQVFVGLDFHGLSTQPLAFCLK
jgi:hypothetical protein